MRLFAELTPLTHEEDRDLRRLEAMRNVGALSPAAQSRYDELRRRDRRKTVRPVDDQVSFIPAPRDPGDDAF
jgi:hypothetical protein